MRRIPPTKVIAAAAVLLFACGFSASAASLTDGLIAHYPMNQLDGDTLRDASGKERDAFVEHVECVPGRGGHVFAFDGKLSKISLPEDSAFEVTGDYGISFWMRVPVDSAIGGPIYAQPSFKITDFRGTLRITFQNPAYPGTGYGDLMGPKMNDGEWHHIVFSYKGDGGEADLFIDGQDLGRRKFAHKPEVSTPTTVGFAGRFHFTGELSDLRVYSRTLDLEDAAALFNAKLAP